MNTNNNVQNNNSNEPNDDFLLDLFYSNEIEHSIEIEKNFSSYLESFFQFKGDTQTDNEDDNHNDENEIELSNSITEMQIYKVKIVLYY